MHCQKYKNVVESCPLTQNYDRNYFLSSPKQSFSWCNERRHGFLCRLLKHPNFLKEDTKEAVKHSVVKSIIQKAKYKKIKIKIA